VKITRKVRIAAAVAASALALTGINASAAQAAPNTSAKGIHIVVMGGAPSDPFWSTVKNGTLDAGLAIENAGGKVTVVSMPNYDNFNADAAKLVAKMKTLKPSAVVIPNWVPASQNANIKKISAAGIPVIIYNSGQDSVKDVNAKIYIGSDEYVAGKAGGKQFATAGAKNVICVNTLPGAANTEARCKGVKDGATGAKVTNVNLPTSQFGDATAVTQAIKSSILKDDTIDGVITISQADSDSAAAAIKQAGLTSKIKLGTFDVAPNGLARIKAGTQLFSLDQQPYAQGYYATSYAFQLAAYAIALPVEELLSGPSVVTKGNVSKIEKAAKAGRR
jgi:simple sugar transport system substrate-binding protein